MNDYKKRLLNIFLPLMISNVIGQIQLLIDRIFLGRLDILYMSAVGNTSSAVSITLALIFSMGTGASILISQAYGAGDVAKAKRYSASLLLYQNILPVILFFIWVFCSPIIFSFMNVGGEVADYCVTYVRYLSPVFLLTGAGSAIAVCFQTSNNTKPLVLYGFIRSSLNVILDYLLIFGNFGFPEMGIAGAALATTISEFVGAIYILIVFIKNKKIITKPDWNELIHAKIKLYIESTKLGINAAVEEFGWSIGNLLIISILNTIDNKVAGVYSILFSLEQISIVVIGALGSSTVTLTSEAAGAKNFKLFRHITKTAFLWSIFAATFALLLYILFPSQLLSIFTTDYEVIISYSLYLVLVGINMFSKSGNIIVGSAIRGSGNTTWMMITQVVGTVCMVIVASVLVNVMHWGMIGVFIAVMMDEAVRAIVNLSKFLKIRFEL